MDKNQMMFQMTLGQQMLVTLVVAAATVGFLGGLAWLVAYLNTPLPGHESIFELLHKAGITCPYCGRPPTTVSRNGYVRHDTCSLSCDLMHVWWVTDDQYITKKEKSVQC